MGLRRRRAAGTDVTDAAAGTAGEITRKAGRAARRAGAATEKAGADLQRRAPMTPARAKRTIAIGKAVAPLLAPYALAAAGVARARWDAHRAGRLGIAPEELTAYSGRGGALHARISRIAATLVDLDSDAEVHATGSARRFVADTRPRLADLAVAVRAAEQMPTSRRRTAYRAIGGELDRIEADLLGHLGITT